MHMTAASIDANVSSPIAACPASCRIFHFRHSFLFSVVCCGQECNEGNCCSKNGKLKSTCGNYSCRDVANSLCGMGNVARSPDDVEKRDCRTENALCKFRPAVRWTSQMSNV